MFQIRVSVQKEECCSDAKQREDMLLAQGVMSGRSMGPLMGDEVGGEAALVSSPRK